MALTRWSVMRPLRSAPACRRAIVGTRENPASRRVRPPCRTRMNGRTIQNGMTTLGLCDCAATSCPSTATEFISVFSTL